jgi:hypothetical protein
MMNTDFVVPIASLYIYVAFAVSRVFSIVLSIGVDHPMYHPELLQPVANLKRNYQKDFKKKNVDGGI